MRSPARHAPLLKYLVAVCVLAAAASGCTGQKKTAQDAVDQYFKSAPGAKRATLARFAGHVAIDGLPPEKGGDYKLFILLNDPQHPQKLPMPYMAVADDGSFDFMTYLAGDGVPVGKYVVEFVHLHLPRQRGRQGFGVARTYVGPDKLKNLYNDPEKNLKDRDFLVEVTEPGRDDYQFNLSVAGKDPVTTPGKYAATVVPGL